MTERTSLEFLGHVVPVTVKYDHNPFQAGNLETEQINESVEITSMEIELEGLGELKRELNESFFEYLKESRGSL